MATFNKVDKIVNVIGSIMLALMLLLSTFNIISNWVTGNRYAQVEELVMAAFVWVVYIGIGSLYRHNEHICVSFLVHLMPQKLQKIVLIFDDIVMLFASCVVAYYAAKLTLISFTMFTSTLRLPYAVIDFAVVLGFAYVVVDLLFRGAKVIFHAKHSESSTNIEKKECDQ